MNPIIQMTEDGSDSIPLVELKQHIVFFVNSPPGPISARKIFDAYLSYFGDIFKVYKATYPGAVLKDWTPRARDQFELQLLPQLRARTEWGYGFSDGKPKDSWLFMFHGFRPFQQPNLASFYRFEFDWQASSELIRGFAELLNAIIPCLSAYGGYFLQGRPGSKYGALSSDKIFALAMRFWGCEVTDIEVTAAQMKKGYKCVNWLTIIGEPFRSQFQQEINQAKSSAYDSAQSQFGTLLVAAEKPLIGDRNRLENLEGYVKIAKALLPVQIGEHGSFGGNRWTEHNSMAWIRRFTHPDDVA